MKEHQHDGDAVREQGELSRTRRIGQPDDEKHDQDGEEEEGEADLQTPLNHVFHATAPGNDVVAAKLRLKLST
jgi:hypothetical protein